MKENQQVVARLLNLLKPKSILDAPCGNGVFDQALNFSTRIDGIDLFETRPVGYENFWCEDLDYGLPAHAGQYETIVCCEGIEHLANPGLFFKTVHDHLETAGNFIVTTPNVWYPAAKLQFLLRGFFPSFPCLVGKMKRGTHMHIMPWSFPHLYLFLTLAGFEDIQLHDIDEKKPKRLYEHIVGWPQKMYCRHKLRKSGSAEESHFWTMSGSRQSLFGRRLVVSAKKKVPNTPA